MLKGLHRNSHCLHGAIEIFCKFKKKIIFNVKTKRNVKYFIVYMQIYIVYMMSEMEIFGKKLKDTFNIINNCIIFNCFYEKLHCLHDVRN